MAANWAATQAEGCQEVETMAAVAGRLSNDHNACKPGRRSKCSWRWGSIFHMTWRRAALAPSVAFRRSTWVCYTQHPAAPPSVRAGGGVSHAYCLLVIMEY